MSRQQGGTGYVAALVARLGGEVTITDEEAARAGDLTIRHDAMRNEIVISMKPLELVGEIVTAEPQSIEPPVCRHPFDRSHWTLDGDLICGPCGLKIGHDKDMRVRSINGGMSI